MPVNDSAGPLVTPFCRRPGHKYGLGAISMGNGLDCLYACLWIFRSNIEDHAWAFCEAVKCYRDALAYCAAYRAQAHDHEQDGLASEVSHAWQSGDIRSDHS
jgi:hypothetical protein